MMRGGNRQMRRQMDRMGVQMEEVENVQEVIIRTDTKEIVLPKAKVNEMKTKDDTSLYMVTADSYEERELKTPVFSDEDVEFVCDRTGADKESAKRALAESDGAPAKAILLLETD